MTKLIYLLHTDSQEQLFLYPKAVIIYPCNYRNAVRAVVVRNPVDLDLCVLFLIEIVSYGSRNLSVSLLIRTLDVSTTLMLIHCFSILLHKN